MNRAAARMRMLLVALPVSFMLAMLLVPAMQGLVLSFDSHGPSLRNYGTVLSDRYFWRAFANNLIVPLGSLIVEFSFGLGLALLMTSRRRVVAAVEVAAILPFALPEIVVLTMARYIFLPRGYLNGLLQTLGATPPDWIAPNSILALLTVIVVDAWHVTPVVMLILMAGLQTIPVEVYEAAMLDGAGTWATFRYVTLPLLAPAMIGALVLRGIDALRIFSTTLVVTGAEGVPVLSTYAYQLWSDAQEPRLAMAASALLAVLITVLGIAGTAALRRSGASAALT
jgi:trehalose transport system permease protein